MSWITEEEQAFKTLRETFGVTDEEIRAALDVEEFFGNSPLPQDGDVASATAMLNLRNRWIKQGFSAIVSAVTQQRAQQARVLGALSEGVPPAGWRPNFRGWAVEIAARGFDVSEQHVEGGLKAGTMPAQRMVEAIEQALEGRFKNDWRWAPSRAPSFYYAIGDDDTGESGLASRSDIERELLREESKLDLDDVAKARAFINLDPPAPPGSFVLVGENMEKGEDEIHTGVHLAIVRVDDEEWKNAVKTSGLEPLQACLERLQPAQLEQVLWEAQVPRSALALGLPHLRRIQEITQWALREGADKELRNLAESLFLQKKD